MVKVQPIGIVPPMPAGGAEEDSDESEEKNQDKGKKKEKREGSIVHVAVTEYRNFMNRMGWYDSAVAIAVRRFLRGKFFAVVAMICLFVALFAGELFVIFESEQNVVLDTVLMLVLLIFSFEFFGLAATDASYLFSFFFWMDLVGTISMIFDISFMLGTDATEPEKYIGTDGGQNMIVVRAARATKLGARAGRLSRVMKLLRFLPFVNGGDNDSNVKMARVISSQLTNVLSTRVAFLVICIVVVLPIFGMFTYPMVDDSMSTWAELLALNSKDMYTEWTKVPSNRTELGLAQRRLDRELNAFASFYSDLSYGPFKACFGYDDDAEGVSMNCHGDLFGTAFQKSLGYKAIQFNSSFKEPGRKNFIRIVSEDDFMAAFDLSTPRQYESVANISLIVFIIIIMCTFGMVTSNSITVIALHPLERMLSVVRQRCKQIFKYTDVLEEDEDDDEDSDEDNADPDKSSEFALLEKVVAKLAAIVHLSNTKDTPEAKEDMTEDEVMTLNWMQGTQMPMLRPRGQRSQIPSQGEVESAGGESGHGQAPQKSMLDSIDLEVIGMLETNSFCTIDLEQEAMHPIAAHIILSSPGSKSWVRTNVQDVHVFKFVNECESKYKPNLFHNYAHALDVQYAAFRCMKLIEADAFIPETSQFWLLVACIAHDLGHIGVNNQFLIESSHELALKYNDRSPLENMHCATLFQVVSDPQANVFAGVEKDLYKEMRKGIIQAILHTDVTKHQEMMKELVMLYQMNSEAFDVQKDENQGPTETIVEILHDHMQLTLNAILHCSDVGNPMKPWEIARRLAYLCVDEFFAQGDQEKAMGIPVQMLNDRDKVNRPNSQIGFIEFVIAPMVEGIVHIFPTMDGLADNLGTNIQHWFEVWVGDSSPAPEVKTKTEARVKKVCTRCTNAMRDDDKASVREQ